MLVRAVFAFFAPIFLLNSSLVAQSLDLVPQPPQTVGQRVRVKLEIRGNLVLEGADAQEAQGEEASAAGESSKPMEVDAAFEYRERSLRSSQSTRTIRCYETARAQIDYGNGQRESTLADEHRWIVADRRDSDSKGRRMRYLVSTRGLSPEEFDLITIPASTVVWDALLAGREISPSSAWAPDDVLLADVLGIDTVEENRAELKLVRVEGDRATIRLSGEVVGRVDDAETELQLDGEAVFDVRGGFTQELRLTINEGRALSESAPGYDAVFKLELSVARPAEDVLPQSELTDQKLEARRWTDTLLLTGAARGFRLRYDRRWRLISNEPQVAVLRYVDDGALLAQCNIQPLNRIPSPEAYTERAFREEVAEVTREKGRIADDQTWTSDRGLHVMTIDVRGVVDEVPITWRYYHVAQPDGQRVSILVTFDTQVEDRLAGADRRLVEAIECIEAPRTSGTSTSSRRR